MHSPREHAQEERVGLLGKEVADSDVENGMVDAESSRTPIARQYHRLRRLVSKKGKARQPESNGRSFLALILRFVKIVLFVILVILALFGLLELLVGPPTLLWRHDTDSVPPAWWPDWGRQPGGPGDGLAGYPSDFTRDVIPIPVHSHNDYWRRIPLYEAVHYGCTSVEADVWLISNELYVGHSPVALSKNRTFQSLYVNPLRQILDGMNPQTPFSNTSRNGVFDEDSSQTLVLLVDFKNNGHALYPVVKEQLAPLRERNYLTFFNGKEVVPGPITVVGTGNTPFDLVQADAQHREIFFDAPLGIMGSDEASAKEMLLKAADEDPEQGLNGVKPEAGTSQFDNGNSFYASTDFISTIGYPWRGYLTDNQMLKLRAQIRGAKEKGLKSRYWNLPSWPIGLRNKIWQVLVDEGVSYLNVDDLYSASKLDWSR